MVWGIYGLGSGLGSGLGNGLGSGLGSSLGSSLGSGPVSGLGSSGLGMRLLSGYTYTCDSCVLLPVAR